MRNIKEFASFTPKWTTTASDNSISFRSSSTAGILKKYASNATRMPRWASQYLTARPHELHRKTQPKPHLGSGVNIGALLMFGELLAMAEELGYYTTPNDRAMFDQVSGQIKEATHHEKIVAYLLSGGVITIECEDDNDDTVMSELSAEDVSRGLENAPEECIIRLVSGENDELDVDTALRSVVDTGKKI
jgi:hypothetical protein